MDKETLEALLKNYDAFYKFEKKVRLNMEKSLNDQLEAIIAANQEKLDSLKREMAAGKNEKTLQK